MNKLLEYLSIAEGKLIHHNDGEKDITCPYGIYNKKDSKMYQYIVELGESIELYTPTEEWTKQDISEVNELVILSQYGVDQLASEFYREYFKKAHMDIYPAECQVAIYSLFTLSPRATIKAVQQSIHNLVKSERVGLLVSEISKVDGKWGSKTECAIRYIANHSSVNGYAFEDSILLAMSNRLIKIWSKKPSLHSKHLHGWSNRLNTLATIR